MSLLPTLGHVRRFFYYSEQYRQIRNNPELFFAGRVIRDTFNSPIARKAAVVIAATRILVLQYERFTYLQKAQNDLKTFATDHFPSIRNRGPILEGIYAGLHMTSVAFRLAAVVDNAWRLCELYGAEGDEELEFILVNLKEVVLKVGELPPIDWETLYTLPFPDAVKPTRAEAAQIEAFIRNSTFFSPPSEPDKIFRDHDIPDFQLPPISLPDEE